MNENNKVFYELLIGNTEPETIESKIIDAVLSKIPNCVYITGVCCDDYTKLYRGLTSGVIQLIGYDINNRVSPGGYNGTGFTKIIRINDKSTAVSGVILANMNIKDFDLQKIISQNNIINHICNRITGAINWFSKYINHNSNQDMYTNAKHDTSLAI